MGPKTRKNRLPTHVLQAIINKKEVQTLRDEMLLVLLNTFSTQYNEFDFLPIYKADSAGSRILSFLKENNVLLIITLILNSWLVARQFKKRD